MQDAARVVFGAPEADPLMQAIVRGIEAAGIGVVEIGLDPTSKDDAAHEARYRAALVDADLGERPIIGGFSIGARIAVGMCQEVEPLALICLGFPFKTGLRALSRVRVPTRIIQGTRDSHGNEADVRTFELPRSVEIVWVENGNHRFIPRRRSGLTHEANIQTVTDSAVSFIRSLYA